MKLSIIIPYYNSIDSIEKLLDSILKECVDTEVIVVDDNSDKYGEAFLAVKKKYDATVLFFSNDSGSKGAGAARNVGISKARGEWILFADSDDYFTEGWFEKVKGYFDKDYDIVFFATTSLNVSTQKVATRHQLFSKYVTDYVDNKGNHDSELYLRYFFVVPWGKLIRALVIHDNDIKFDEVMHSNDVMFSVKTGHAAKKVTADPASIYCVTENGTSLTTDISENAWGIRHNVFCSRNLFLREKLSKRDYMFCVKRMKAYERLCEAIHRKCGLRNLIVYIKQYRRYKVPLFVSATHYYRCCIGIGLRKMKLIKGN